MGIKKKPKMAHIVPVSCLEKTKDNQYHMCLAHLVMQSEKYASFYRRMSDEGKFVLMDNGAAEGSQLSVSELIECYNKIRPTEIVLPDTLLDANDTIEKSELAYDILMEYYDRRLPFTLMAVPQGRDIFEWKECMRKMIRWVGVHSIGVSKFLEMVTRNKWVRYNAVQAIKQELQKSDVRDIEVHLLGCSDGTQVVRNILEDFSFVRGCDSAFVYLMSQAGESERTGDIIRPAGEIDFLNGKDYESLESNMAYFNYVVGIDNSIDSSWK